MKKLSEFVEECGSQELAARKIGVPLNSLWRWLHGGKVSKAWSELLRNRGLEQ